MAKRVRFHTGMTPEIRHWLTAIRRCGATLKTAIGRYHEPDRVGGSATNGEYRRRAAAADQTILGDALRSFANDIDDVCREIAERVAADGPPQA
jgi:hypothetical protein